MNIATCLSGITLLPLRRIVLLAGVALCLNGSNSLAATTKRPPNVIFLYADDLGYADISYNSSFAKVSRRKLNLAHTPNIDKICQNGVFMDDYVTHHVCSPSRAGLLTGRHYTKAGSGLSVGGDLDATLPNIARDFQANGYVTGAYGKWHNGRGPIPDTGKGAIPGVGVNGYGFDEWSGFYGGGQDYHTRIDKGEVDWWTNGKQHTEEVEGYSTYILRDLAVNFIDKNADKPFFLYVPFSAVHTPYHILNTDLEAMCDIHDEQYPELAWSKVNQVVSLDPNSDKTIGEVLQMRCSTREEFDKVKINRQLRGFGDLVHYTVVYAMDQAVGDILAKVAEKGLSDNTIIVFSSDNGATQSGNNGMQRGQKMTIWEGGIRVPAAIWWPGQLEASRKPYSSTDNRYEYFMQYTDWYPTLIAAAGQKISPAAQLDGINLFSNLQNRTDARPGFADCYYGLDDQWAVLRSGRYKLHYNQVPGEGRVEELYDLKEDKEESINLAANGGHPELLHSMKTMLCKWFESGEVTTSYMQLPDYVDRNARANPEGELLEVTAIQDAELKELDEQGVRIRFAMPKWKRSLDEYVHPGDVLEYDIYVADDSEQVCGFFVSPSHYIPLKGEGPLFDSTHGIGLDGGLLIDQVLPKGKWVRCAAGIGDVAPSKSLDMSIGLFSKKAGKYHFYIDNVVIRKEDGTVRTLVWEKSEDTRVGSTWIYFKGRYYPSFELLPKDDDLHFSAIKLTSKSLDAIR